MAWPFAAYGSLTYRARSVVVSPHLAGPSGSRIRRVAVCDGEDREYTEVYKQFNAFLSQNTKNSSLHDIIKAQSGFRARKSIPACILLSC